MAQVKKQSIFRRWRPFTWVLIAFNLIMLIWLVGGLASGGDPCAGEVGDALEACRAGAAIGTGIGVALILTIWIVVGFILGMIWLVTGRGQRHCPVCGNRVKKGLTVCPACGHDFRQAAAPGAAPA